MGQWVFEELRGAAMRRTPQEVQLFKNEQAVEGEYAGTDALVREVIQNSLDARHGSGPVRVRIAIHEPNEAPREEQLAHYFGRLEAPLGRKGVTFKGTGVPALPCRFLVCEDFGTRGLEGDVTLFKELPPGQAQPEDFYWFWRNSGRSAKTGEELGRWGLGKLVYRAASRIGCMLGLTVRQSDGRRYLMGQAVLDIHQHNGREYQPEGFWCACQDKNGLPLPIEGVEELDRFCREWKLERTSEPGLSVVSPYLHDEVKAENLLQAVAVHFFWRILLKHLEVVVVGCAAGPQVLRWDTIAEVCRSIEWSGPKRAKRHAPPPLDFAAKCMRAPLTATSRLMGADRLPEMAEAFSEEELNRLWQHFSVGDLLHLRMRLSLPLVGGGREAGELDVYLQRCGVSERRETYYIREGMTITKIGSRAAQHGVQALAVVDHGPLARLLGDTEGPAHEDWFTSAERPNQTWKTWKGRVTFVRRIVDRLVELLTPPATQADYEALVDFFSLQRTEGKQRAREPGTDDEEDAAILLIEKKPKWFQINERAGGFTICRNPAVPMPEAPRLKVSVAYDMPQGDPLRSWSPFDFRISNGPGSLVRCIEGASMHCNGSNVVWLTIHEEEFRFTLDGFDRNLDLFVRVDDINAELEPEDAGS